MYRDFKNILLESELEEDTLKLRRNQLLNNFETASNPQFVKYFSEKHGSKAYTNDYLKKVIKKSAIRINNLKINIRDLPKQLIMDEDLKNLMADDDLIRKATIPNEPLVLRTRKNPTSLEDQSIILSSLRKNIDMYGLRDGLKKTDTALIPQRILEQGMNPDGDF
jgi:hypothetical protein